MYCAVIRNNAKYLTEKIAAGGDVNEVSEFP
jgi:hypothetical protein